MDNLLPFIATTTIRVPLIKFLPTLCARRNSPYAPFMSLAISKSRLDSVWFESVPPDFDTGGRPHCGTCGTLSFGHRLPRCIGRKGCDWSFPRCKYVNRRLVCPKGVGLPEWIDHNGRPVQGDYGYERHRGSAGRAGRAGRASGSSGAGAYYTPEHSPEAPRRVTLSLESLQERRKLELPPARVRKMIQWGGETEGAEDEEDANEESDGGSKPVSGAAIPQNAEERRPEKSRCERSPSPTSSHASASSSPDVAGPRSQQPRDNVPSPSILHEGTVRNATQSAPNLDSLQDASHKSASASPSSTPSSTSHSTPSMGFPAQPDSPKPDFSTHIAPLNFPSSTPNPFSFTSLHTSFSSASKASASGFQTPRQQPLIPKDWLPTPPATQQKAPIPAFNASRSPQRPLFSFAPTSAANTWMQAPALLPTHSPPAVPTEPAPLRDATNTGKPVDTACEGTRAQAIKGTSTPSDSASRRAPSARKFAPRPRRSDVAGRQTPGKCCSLASERQGDQSRPVQRHGAASTGCASPTASPMAKGSETSLQGRNSSSSFLSSGAPGSSSSTAASLPQATRDRTSAAPAANSMTIAPKSPAAPAISVRTEICRSNEAHAKKPQTDQAGIFQWDTQVRPRESISTDNSSFFLDSINWEEFDPWRD